MQVNVQSLNQAAGELAAFVEQRVRFVMRRRADLLPHVTVVLQDVNGPRGGPDKECRIALRTPRHGTLIARALSTTWRRAVRAALVRAMQLIVRAEGRQQARRRAHPPITDAN